MTHSREPGANTTPVSSPMPPSDRPILITGASSGIGLVTARACAAAGMPVALAARRTDRLDQAVGEIARLGGRAVAIACDVANPDDCRRAVDTCTERLGPLHAVFANAGYGIQQPALDTTDQDARRIFDVNFFGTLSTVRAAVEAFRRQPAPPDNSPRGRVLICSSCLARMPAYHHALYTATKAAQHHLAATLRAELEPEAIAVTSVHPVGTRTEFFDTAAYSGKNQPGAMTSQSPDRLMQNPEQVAARIVRCLMKPRPEPEIWPGATGLGIRLLAAAQTAIPALTTLTLRSMRSRTRAAQR